MAWTIHTWSPTDGAGTIVSPHFGPIAFDSTANVDRVEDFRVGEAVFVELDGDAPAFRVRVIRPFSQRQPPNTLWPAFDEINGRFGDVFLEHRADKSLGFWLGDCCQYCTPNPTRVRFDEVLSVVGLDDIGTFSEPLFRLASLAEIERHHLVVPHGFRAFCIVTEHGQGVDGPLIFIVASEVDIVEPDILQTPR